MNDDELIQELFKRLEESDVFCTRLKRALEKVIIKLNED